ncbi:hypothetical protein ACVBEJ_06585 [Porticoccus sp. GXU_MW_L64]
MAYMVIHIEGNNEEAYPLEKLPTLYSELEGIEDAESYVALTHESEWCLSAYANGTLVWENNFSELDESWYMEGVPEQKVIELWSLLASGNIDLIKQQTWQLGDPVYGI